MLPFSDRFGLQGVYQVKSALRVPNRARPFRESLTADERGKTSRKQAVGSLFPLEETTVHRNSVSQYRQSRFVSHESRSSFVPSMRRFAELFLHSLTRVVRPRIKKKRLCDSTSARVLSFLRLTYRGLNGKTARTPGISAGNALCEALSCNISRDKR